MSEAHERERRGVFDEHLSECDECRRNGATIAVIDRLLVGVASTAIDSAALSQRVLAAARPELARRARGIDWRRLAAAMVGSLIPLPLVLGVNLLGLATVHALLTMAGLPGLASYVVASYTAGIVFVLGATYAAIPVLVERSAGPRSIPLA